MSYLAVNAIQLHLLFCSVHCRVNSSGVAVQQWVSMVRDLMPHKFLGTPKTHMHGGPPLVHVSAAASGSGKPYYLGVMHYYDVSGDVRYFFDERQ
jgi:hypothetical protein